MAEPQPHPHQVVDLTDPKPDLPDDMHLRAISASEALGANTNRLASARQRQAVINIRAYLRLLADQTDISEDDLRSRFGCERHPDDLPNCTYDELRSSEMFLIFVSELVLIAERSEADLQEVLPLAIRAYAIFRRAVPLVALLGTSVELLGDRFLEMLEAGDLKGAWTSLHDRETDFHAGQFIRTGDGRLVFLSEDAARGALQGAMGGRLHAEITRAASTREGT